MILRSPLRYIHLAGHPYICTERMLYPRNISLLSSVSESLHHVLTRGMLMVHQLARVYRRLPGEKRFYIHAAHQRDR